MAVNRRPLRSAAVASSRSGSETMTQVGHAGAFSPSLRLDHTAIAISYERTRASWSKIIDAIIRQVLFSALSRASTPRIDRIIPSTDFLG